MGVKILLIIVVAGLLCAAVRYLSPRRGDWLPILVSALLPPLLIVPFGILSMLRDIGASTPDGEQAPLGTVDKFADGFGALLTFAALWVVIGGITAVLVLHFYKRLAGRP